MPNNPDEIRVFGNGNVYVAAIGAAAPATVLTAVDPLVWTLLGLTSEEGATFIDAKTVEPIPVWQMFYPARRIVTEKDSTVAFVLRQWNRPNVVFAFGGGTVTEDAPGAYRYTPPAPGTIDERQLLLEGIDGDFTYRLIIPRGMVSENVETQWFRTGAADLPITFGVNGSESSDAWYLQTDDPAFEPAAS